jgi:hypothetical protein
MEVLVRIAGDKYKTPLGNKKPLTDSFAGAFKMLTESLFNNYELSPW